jgi:hypothetical protein
MSPRTPNPGTPNPGTPNPNPEPGTLNPEPGGDTPMTSTYVKVLVLEAAIIAALFVFGRMFS